MSSMVAVAREANVAVSTVSLHLNHRERVKPATRERIEEAIRRVGYQPRQAKSGIRDNHRLSIALIYTLDSLLAGGDHTMSGYCREIISGLQEAVAGTPSSLNIFRGVEHVDQDPIVTEQIKAQEFDGVILFGSQTRDGYLQRLQEAKVPLVALNRVPEHGRFSCVTLDYYGGAQIAIRHLHSLGHRRIAFVMNDLAEKWLIREVSAGARAALREVGLEPVVDDVGWADPNDPQRLKQFCDAVIEQKATAIFTGDHMAIHCADALAARGVRVPQDVSIVGFDDRGVKTAAGLSLTTIGYDRRRMGRMAINMLQQLTQSQGKLCWLAGAVSTHLVEGQTTAAIAVTE